MQKLQGLSAHRLPGHLHEGRQSGYRPTQSRSCGLCEDCVNLAPLWAGRQTNECDKCNDRRVGGQGTLLASRLLGNAMLSKGLDVKVSEVHGMSQRGGSVVTYVRYGDQVHSPVIEKGEADYILAFEQLEAARWLPFLKKGGKLVVNTQCIDRCR